MVWVMTNSSLFALKILICVSNETLTEGSGYASSATSKTGRYNSKIHIDIGIWNKKTKLGETFDSSTGFKLPNGAERS